jgi:hypothetical protein
MFRTQTGPVLEQTGSHHRIQLELESGRVYEKLQKSFQEQPLKHMLWLRKARQQKKSS